MRNNLIILLQGNGPPIRSKTLKRAADILRTMMGFRPYGGPLPVTYLYSASIVEIPIVISSSTSKSTRTVSSDVSIVIPLRDAHFLMATPST